MLHYIMPSCIPSLSFHFNPLFSFPEHLFIHWCISFLFTFLYSLFLNVLTGCICSRHLSWMSLVFHELGYHPYRLPFPPSPVRFLSHSAERSLVFPKQELAEGTALFSRPIFTFWPTEQTVSLNHIHWKCIFFASVDNISSEPAYTSQLAPRANNR